jgi:acyl-CoA synthetase (AMP-forming)/AMP-acid ligase II
VNAYSFGPHYFECTSRDTKGSRESFELITAGFLSLKKSVTLDNMRQVIQELRSKGVSTGFGMTEGSPIWSASVQDPESLITGELTIAGFPSPEAYHRLCATDSKTPVPRGEFGEIYQSGPGVTQAYLGGVSKEEF